MANRDLVPDVVEHILQRLPVKPLLRFKSVSKKWKSIIESHRFQKQHFLRRKQSRGTDVLIVSVIFDEDKIRNTDNQRIIVGSSRISTIWLPVSNSLVCHGSCDGLICLFCNDEFPPNYVVNPATGWNRTFPLSNIQQVLKKLGRDHEHSKPLLGFGKDKKGTYKAVILYNSSDFGLKNFTTCELFDFSTNAWRYVLPASPYLVNDWQPPVYLDGSLHWLTACEEDPEILSFDLETETFQALCDLPFNLRGDDPHLEIMSILDNRLCVSEVKEVNVKEEKKPMPIQVIWLYDSSGPNKKWKQLCCLDLKVALDWFKDEMNFPLAPIAIVGRNKILLQGKGCSEKCAIFDLNAKAFYSVPIKPKTRGHPVYYYQSLFSAN